MKYDNIEIKLLGKKYANEIAVLAQTLNPSKSTKELYALNIEMFDYSNYKCFGLFVENDLVGISSGWITTKFYSGKQLEVDNVIINPKIQSKGLGKVLFEFIENWAWDNQCKTIELNTYVSNSGSHKFYFNLGYSILGFHFQKKIT